MQIQPVMLLWWKLYRIVSSCCCRTGGCSIAAISALRVIQKNKCGQINEEDKFLKISFYRACCMTREQNPITEWEMEVVCFWNSPSVLCGGAWRLMVWGRMWGERVETRGDLHCVVILNIIFRTVSGWHLHITLILATSFNLMHYTDNLEQVCSYVFQLVILCIIL